MELAEGPGEKALSVLSVARYATAPGHNTFRVTHSNRFKEAMKKQKSKEETKPMSVALEENYNDFSTPVEVDELPAGDYLVEVTELKDRTKMFRESVDSAGAVTFRFLRYELRVLSPVDLEGEMIFHSTMVWAADPVSKKTGKPYNPRSMTFEFLRVLGAVEEIRKDGKRISQLKPEFILPGGDINYDALVGLQCNIKLAPSKREGSDGRIEIAKAWAV